MRLLIVEDEVRLASFMRRGFLEENYAVDTAHDGATGIHLAQSFDYSLAVVDIMLPDISGFDVLQAIHKHKPYLPVLILSARGMLEDRLRGLTGGADDYMVKPFAFAELSARVRNLLRRGAREGQELRVGDLVLNVTTHAVTRGGTRIELSKREFALLEFLMRHARRPVTRTMIIENVWDPHFDSISNVVEVYINYLRRKIDRKGSTPLIRTVRAVGYMLTDEPL